MLIYDNHKRDRRERRLPISQATAAVITTQQQQVRGRFPDTPLAELVLLLSPHANPTGAKSLSGGLLDLHATATGSTNSRSCAARTAPSSTGPRSSPYAYRHAPTPNATPTPVIAVDVLSKLLDHPHARGHPPLLPGQG